GDLHPDRVVVAADRRVVRDQHPVGDPAGLLLPRHRRETVVPDGPVAPHVRAEGVGRVDGGEPLLDHRRAVRARRPGSVLRRVGVGDMTGRPDFLTGPHPSADRSSDWSAAHVVVAGLGGSGFAAADGLLEFGARVTVLDDGDGELLRERATLLETLGATVRLGAGSTATLPDDTHLLVPFPGLPPRHPLLARAAAEGIGIWGEPELAWRLSRPDRPAWLGVTGTNGKTTTVQMLESMLR